MRSLLLVPALVFPLSAQGLSARLQTAQRARPEVLRTLQADLAASPASPWKTYHEAHLAYLLVGPTRGTDAAGAEALLDQGIRTLEARKDAESQALLASCLCMKMSFAPDQAMTLAPRANALMEGALRQSPASPRIQLLKGIGLLNTPAAYGGGPARALPILEAAAKAALAEAAPADPWAPAWGKAEVHAWLAMAQSAAGRMEEARASLDKALALDPDYAFAKHVVRPRLQAKS